MTADQPSPERRRRPEPHPDAGNGRTAAPEHARSLPRRLTGRRPWVRLLVIGLLLAAVTWVGTRAWIAKQQLEEAQTLIEEIKATVADGDYEDAVDGYAGVQERTSTARAMTDDPLWSLAEHVPSLGRNLLVMRQVTEAIDDAVVALSPLVDVAGELDPTALAPEDGRIPLERVVAAGAAITSARADLEALVPRVGAIDTQGVVSQLAAARAQLADLVESFRARLADAEPIVRALPELLGADGPRTYVVMFLNSAELRSLGGSATTFAEITLDQGAIGAPVVHPAGDGTMTMHGESVIPVPDGFDDVYGGSLGRWIANATLRPSEQTAAEIVAAEWLGTYGREVDGVFSMDGGALSLLLQAVGPLTLSTGDVVDSSTVVSLLFNQVYQRYSTGDLAADDAAQGAVYAETVAQTFTRLSSGQFDPAVLFSSMVTAGEQGHASLWLADESERTILDGTALAAGDLPEGTATEDVVGVYLNDQVGSKLNYYLASTVTTATGACGPDGRAVHRVTTTLTNLLSPEAAAALSPSITGVIYPYLGLAKGEQRLVMFLYLPPGAEFAQIREAGVVTAATGNHDTDRPVHVLRASIPPGTTYEFSFDVLMPDAAGRDLVVDVTPTVQGTTTQSTPLDCATVTLP